VSDLEAHFDALHASDADPWAVMTSWYERRKRSLTMAALPNERYRSAFEPGCSIGAVTELLAERCDRVVAMDVAPSAVDRCRARLSGRTNVRIVQGRVPDDWPAGRFDLVVLSELGYYLGQDDVEAVVERCCTRLAPDGHLVAVHWSLVADDFRCSGQQVHEHLHARPELAGHAHYEDPDFQLDVFVRSPE
jgi:SAM-dependent methyltransferase